MIYNQQLSLCYKYNTWKISDLQKLFSLFRNLGFLKKRLVFSILEKSSMLTSKHMNAMSKHKVNEIGSILEKNIQNRINKAKL